MRVTLQEEITQKLIDELDQIMPKNERLPNPTLQRDGTRFRYKFQFDTRHIEEFENNLAQYKVENPSLDIFAEEPIESFFNKLFYRLNLRDLIFPITVTIRYTLDDQTDPKDFKEFLDSYFREYELPEAVFIGENNFNRFKIEYKLRNFELFNSYFARFKQENPDIDIYIETERRSIKSYINIAVYIGAILLAINRGWEFFIWFESVINK